MSALHVANIGGETDAALTDVATTFSSPALAALDAIASPDYLWICVDPDGIGGEPEWMKVTAYTAAAATCTVERAQQGSTARAHASGVEWVHTLAPSEADRAMHLLLHVRDEKAYNVMAGAAATASVWFTRTLNTVVTNEISGASLASNEITLPAGTYEIGGPGAPSLRCEASAARLYNVTAAAVLLTGTAEHSHATSGSTVWSKITGRFTLTATSVVRIEQAVSAANANTYALGHQTTFSAAPSIYTDIVIKKVA